jgi:phage protein U
MPLPLALIGPATLEVIGLNPQGFDWSGEANWAAHPVFDSEPFYQPVSGGEESATLHLACRPHVYGGLENYQALKRILRTREPAPFIRMSGLVGGYQGLVGVRRLSSSESRIAPDGTGWRWEFTVELLFVGASAGGGGW